ncbi:uncharacterized protein [Drosophila suzukii]|uniref:Uncharacterized protein n=1 Tax=Drosophila suzukii TaxID=28584 RepID=A0ABM4TX94_DROSZ
MSNSEERQRQQVQNTADHATWDSIEQNPGLERARDTAVDASARSDSEERRRQQVQKTADRATTQEQRTSTVHHRNIRLQQRLREQQIQEMEMNVVSISGTLKRTQAPGRIRKSDNDSRCKILLTMLPGSRSSKIQDSSAHGTLQWTQAPGRIPKSDDESRCKRLLTVLRKLRTRARTGRCSARKRQVEFGRAQTTTVAKYCCPCYVEIDRGKSRDRARTGRCSLGSGSKERRREQSRNTADHATWRSIEENRGPERSRDAAAHRITRNNPITRTQEQRTSTVHHRNIRLQQRLREQQIQEMEMNVVSISEIPECLKNFTYLVERLIFHRIPFMRNISLGYGRQCGIRGAVENVPISVPDTVSVLSRTFDSAHVIQVHLKRIIPFYSTSNGYKYKVKSDSARDSEAHASARSNSEERQRQQVQNTADHATWESIEQNPGLERARDTAVDASARSDSEERRRQQVQKTADRATLRSVEENRGQERARDAVARAIVRSDSEERRREQSRNTADHATLRSIGKNRGPERARDAAARAIVRTRARTGRCSARKRQVEFGRAQTTTVAKYCCPCYVEIDRGKSRDRARTGRCSLGSGSEERRREQSRNTADHATWRSIEENRGPERSRDSAAHRITRNNPITRTQEQRTSTVHHRNIRLQQRLREQQIQEMEMNVVSISVIAHNDSRCKILLTMLPGSRSSKIQDSSAHGTLQWTQAPGRIPKSDDDSRCKILLTMLLGNRSSKIQDSSAHGTLQWTQAPGRVPKSDDDSSARNRQVEFGRAQTTTVAKYCCPCYVEIDRGKSRDRARTGRCSSGSGSEERRREQSRNTADHATWRSIEENGGPEHSRDSAAHRITRNNPITRAQEQRTSTVHHRNIRLQQRLREQQIQEMEINVVSISEIPECLKNFTYLVERLIFHRIPFMRNISLGYGRQCGIRGAVENVPISVPDTVSVLSRTFDSAHVIQVHLKRM